MRTKKGMRNRRWGDWEIGRRDELEAERGGGAEGRIGTRRRSADS